MSLVRPLEDYICPDCRELGKTWERFKIEPCTSSHWSEGNGPSDEEWWHIRKMEIAQDWDWFRTRDPKGLELKHRMIEEEQVRRFEKLLLEAHQGWQTKSFQAIAVIQQEVNDEKRRNSILHQEISQWKKRVMTEKYWSIKLQQENALLQSKLATLEELQRTGKVVLHFPK